MITFDTHPDRYKHWRLSVDGVIATLTLDVREDGGIVPGYTLKLNSYDLGVDMELYDALQRIRFEHPSVRTVVITSGKEKVFCAGANIQMLASSTHAWKVNFCKFTNETRNGIEDTSATSGVKFLAALNGITAGGGYELALACDEIVLVDDGASAVSLPEVPLLGVLPGTGGLTRVVDKRRVRRDLADVFCTTVEGVRGQRAVDWKLVDHTVSRSDFDKFVDERARALAAASDRPADAEGVTLTPLAREVDERGYHYPHVDVAISHNQRIANLTVRAPETDQPGDVDGILALGDRWWPLAVAREVDDAILMLRVNNGDIGTIVVRTEGEAARVLAADEALHAHRAHWFVRETTNMLRRTLARLDVSSRSLFAIVEKGSCFAGTLAELLLAADRAYMLDDTEAPETSPTVTLGRINQGALAMNNGWSRLLGHFSGDEAAAARVEAAIGKALAPKDALELGIVTFTPDELDWEEEVRIGLEERASLSPDALTGMEASLRFSGSESMDSKIFGRLSAWQNWIFNRPNAIGERGALKVYGTGNKAQFNWERV